jgi:cephalosporin hydroxylase
LRAAAEQARQQLAADLAELRGAHRETQKAEQKAQAGLIAAEQARQQLAEELAEQRQLHRQSEKSAGKAEAGRISAEQVRDHLAAELTQLRREHAELTSSHVQAEKTAQRAQAAQMALEQARTMLTTELNELRRAHDHSEKALLRIETKYSMLEQTCERLERELHSSQAAYRSVERAKARAEAALADSEERRDHLSQELAEIRSSYYMSGAQKKVDIRAVDGFSEAAAKVIEDRRSNMNYDRLYTLWQAIRDTPPECTVVEIGAYKGGSAWFIAEMMRQFDRQGKFYVCDTFTGHAHTDPRVDTAHHETAKFKDTSAADVQRYLADYPNIEIIEGDIRESSARIARGRFGFVHIDVDVYPATDFSLDFFAPRLASGGVIVVDDYGFVTCPGAKRAVDEFISEHSEFRMIHLLTGQAVISRVPRERFWKRLRRRHLRRDGQWGSAGGNRRQAIDENTV